MGIKPSNLNALHEWRNCKVGVWDIHLSHDIACLHCNITWS